MAFLDRLREQCVPEVAWTPDEDYFPKREMAILAAVVLSSALSMTGLFPYVAFMTAEFMHVDVNKSGFYSGWVASSMMLGRLLSSVFWGRLSDRIGRKPVLYVGCCSIIVFSILFGFSVNFWMALITRFLLGLFNPVISVAKTTITEICPPRYQAIGMSLNIGCWSVGLVLGPAIGGLLARPVQNYPHVFRRSLLLEKFPYLIPNLITASLAVCSLILLILTFPETLSRNKNRNKTASLKDSSVEMVPAPVASRGTTNPMYTSSKDSELKVSYSKVDMESSHGMDHSFHDIEMDSDVNGDIDGDSAHNDNSVSHDEADFNSNGYSLVVKYAEDQKEDSNSSSSNNSSEESKLGTAKRIDGPNSQLRQRTMSEDEVKTISTYDLYKLDGVWQAINSQILLAFNSSTINELVPLWAVSSRSRGGLNFTTLSLGTMMTICGAGLFFSTVFFYPFMVGKFGVFNTYLTGVFLMAPVLLALSFSSSSSSTWGLDDDQEYAVVVFILLLVKVCDSMTFASLGTIINQSVDSSKRGTLNGLTMTLAGIGQTAGAILAANGYAWSINSDNHFPFDSHFMFLILIVISLVNGTSFYLLSSPAPIGSVVSPPQSPIASEMTDTKESNS